MRTRTALRRLGFATALSLSVWAVAIGGEPSGGAGRGPNQAQTAGGTTGGDARATGGTRAGAARAANALPWPEPDAKAVEKLKAELRAELPPETFQVLQIGPWIVATDMDKLTAPRYTEYTIARYAADIQRQLFMKHPRSQPLKVMLFRDKTSYETWNEKLFGEKPTTPYGYFSRARTAMVMNIGTGGGTLLHEMVHAMAEEDYPDIPAWLNEGLGSLFEASDRSRTTGKVIGFTNWRLTGLQEDLKKGTATRITDVLDMSDSKFYGARSGANYATARYLMQYLQEQGKVEAFYTGIRDKKYASGAEALRAMFDNKKTLDQIEEAWLVWVKALQLDQR